MHTLNVLLLLLPQILADQFTTVPIRINQIRKDYTLPGCSRLSFNTSYRKLRISVFNQTNIRSLMFTDSVLKSSCLSDTDIYTQCTQNSSFCSYFSEWDKEKELTYSVGFCTQTVYLYVQNQLEQDDNDDTNDEQGQQPVKYKPVTITVGAGYGDTPCNSIAEDRYVMCGRIRPDDCLTKCQLDCVYVKCYQRQFESERFGLCLPKNLTDEEYMERCKMEQKITRFNVTTQCQKMVPRMLAEGKDNPFLSLLIITILIFLFTVLYYRYQLRRTGEAPFNPPSICPLWVYPNPPPRASQS